MSHTNKLKVDLNSPVASTSFCQTSNALKSRKFCSLVPYGTNTTSDSSSDETEAPCPKEIKRKSVSSPRKRKRNYARSLSSKIFPHSNEQEPFQDVYPTDADGAIDVNRLFDSSEKDWASNINKSLKELCTLKDTATLTGQNLHLHEQEISDTEYDIDLGTLELVPALLKSKKKLSNDTDEFSQMSQNKRKSNAEDENVEEEQLVANNTEDENKFAIPKLKPKCRKFIFKPFKRESDGLLVHDGLKSPVEIVIPEQLAASYGLYIWPCSPVLAWYIWLHQEKFQGKSVLELGSGTALPGLLCAKIGANKVWLSDDASQPNTLKNCHEAVKINSLENNVEVIGLSWGDYTENLLKLRNDRPNYIIGSDLFFDPKVFEPLIKTLAYLMSTNQETQVFITVQERSSDWTLEEYLNKWKLCCDYIYPREFLKGTGIDESDLIGGHTIFILRIFIK